MLLSGHAMTDLTGRFLSVDDRFCDLLAREREEIVGRAILAITFDADRATNEKKLAALSAKGEAFAIRKHYVRGNGSLTKVQNIVSMINDGIGGKRLVATVTPLPEPKAAFHLIEMLESARFLSSERRMRPRSFGERLDTDSRWDLLLAAYILEAEGRSTRSFEICAFAEVEEQAGILALWNLIAAKHIEPEARAATLRDMPVRLSATGMDILSQHFQRLREIDPLL